MITDTPVTIEKLCELIFETSWPIGSLYWTEKEGNPATLLGGGGNGSK